MEIAQLMKGLAYEHEDLSLIPRNHVKNMAICPCNPSSREWRQEDSYDSLSSQPSLLCDFQIW